MLTYHKDLLGGQSVVLTASNFLIHLLYTVYTYTNYEWINLVELIQFTYYLLI